MQMKTNTLRGNVASVLGVDGRDGKSAYEIALDNGFEGTEAEWLDFLEGKSAYEIAVEHGFEGTEEEWLDSFAFNEWDYVITSLEDFTTENLATMSGRVLVKGIDHTPDYSDAVRVVVSIPKNVLHIEFVDCSLYATLNGSGNSITGFRGYSPYPHYSYTPVLKNFKETTNCSGNIIYEDCSNISNCNIYTAKNCSYLRDNKCSIGMNPAGDSHYLFEDCLIISGLTVTDFDSVLDIEFTRCKHLSNIHIVSNGISEGSIEYINCVGVDGDTCDGYYTAEDNGKVPTVNTDGSKSLISVYDKTEIDEMIGDISTALDELHTYAQSLVNGGATV